MEDIVHLSLQTIQDIHTITNTNTNVHDANDCKESGCGFKTFFNILSWYLNRFDKTSEQKRVFFIPQYKIFNHEFSFAYKLYTLF